MITNVAQQSQSHQNSDQSEIKADNRWEMQENAPTPSELRSKTNSKHTCFYMV